LTIPVGLTEDKSVSEDPTQITLRTVLEAVNALGVELHNFRTEVNERFERLEAEVKERFDSIEESINVLSGDVTRLRSRTLQVRLHEPPKPEEKERA